MDIFTWIWTQKLHNKIKFFLWLVIYDRLHTSQYLHSRGINLSHMCFFCNKEETIEHILITCDNAKYFRDNLSLQSQISLSIQNIMTDQNRWGCILNKVNQQNLNNLLKWGQLLPLCLWQIWLTRNSNCFNNKRQTIPYNNAIFKVVEFIHMADGRPVKTQELVIRVK